MESGLKPWGWEVCGGVICIRTPPHLLLFYRLHMKVRVHSQIWSSTSGPGLGVDDPTYNVTRVKRSPAGFIRLYQSTHPKLNSLF